MNEEKDQQPVPVTSDKPVLSPGSFYLLAGLALLLPYALLILRLNLGAWPDADYWFMFLQIWSADGSLQIPGLFQTWNKHFMLLGKILYVINTFLAGGSNYGLVAFAISISFLCTVTVSAMWVRLVPSRDDLVRVAGFFAIATAMTPVSASHLFQLGMSGIVWLSANLMALLALAAQNRAWGKEGRSRMLWVTLAGFLGLLGCLSYGTGYAILPALMLVAILAKRPKEELLWLAPWFALSVVLFLYALGQPMMVLEADKLEAQHSETRAAYFKLPLSLALLAGGLFTSDILVSLSVGILVCVLFAFLGYQLYRRQPDLHRLTYYFFGIALFGGGAMMIIILGRFDRTVFYAMTQSRYYSLPSLFLLGTLLCAILLLLKNRQRFKGRSALLLGLAISLVFAGGVLNRNVINWDFERLTKNRAAIYLRLGEPPGFLPIFPSADPAFREVLSAVRALDHYPFNSSFPLHEKLGQTITEHRAVLPLIDTRIEPFTDSSLEVNGTVKVPPGIELELVYLTDETGKIIGAAVPGYEVKIPTAPPEIRVFSGLARPGAEFEELRFYGTLKGQQGYFRFGKLEEQQDPRDSSGEP